MTEQDEGHYRITVEAWNAGIGTHFKSEVSIVLKIKIPFSSCLTNMPAPDPILFPALDPQAAKQAYLHLRTGVDVEHSLPDFTYENAHSCAYRLAIVDTAYTWLSLTG